MSEGGADLSIVHLFPDADAMLAHVNGADERARAAYEHIQPAGWEVYGAGPDEVVAQLGEAAVAAGVDLSVRPASLGGFVRSSVD